jgi:hypothetical protein
MDKEQADRGDVRARAGRGARRAGLHVLPTMLVLLALLPQHGHTATWRFQPMLEAVAEAESNLRLREGGEETVQSTSGLAGIAAYRLTELEELRVAGLAGYTVYSGTDAPDDEDTGILQLDAAFMQERSVLRVGGELRRETTLMDVAAPLGDLDPGGDLDRGLLDESVRRHRLFVHGSFEQALTERLDALVRYSSEYSDYSTDGGVRLSDSWTHRLEAQGLYGLTERTRVGLGAQALLFRAVGAGDDVDTVSLIGTAEHRLTELSSVAALFGVWRAEGTSAAASDDTGYIGQVIGRTRGQNWHTSVTLERSLRPAAEGVLREVDQVRLRTTRDLSPRLAFTLTGRAFEARTAVGAERPDRRYAELAPRLGWRLTPSWTISTRYRYRYRWVGREEPGSAESHAVALMLEYRPPLEWEAE